MVWLVVATARGGCAVDPQEDQHLREAGLVAVGRVVAVDLVGEEVHQTVQLGRVLEGRVDSGFVRLVTSVTGSGCPGDVVYVPDEVVWLIGSPDDGTIPVSPCSRTTGLASTDRDAWLAQHAAGKGGRYAGVGAPPARRAPTAVPTPGPERVRLREAGGWGLAADDHRAGVGGERHDVGAVFATTADRVGAIWPGDGVELALWVDRGALATVPTARIGVPGVTLAPGADVRPTTDGRYAYDDDVVAFVAALPAESLGTVWTADPLPVVAGDHVVRATDLWDRPGGAVVGRLADWTSAVTGSTQGDLVEVTAGGGFAVAHGWVAAGAVSEGGVGFGTGSGWGSRPTLALAPGVTLEPGLGRTTAAVRLPLLAVRGSEAWVEATGPFGPVLARVRCRASASSDGPCDAP